MPGHGVSPQGLLKETRGLILEGVSRGLQGKCILLGDVSNKVKSNFRSSSDPRGMNSNKANSLAEEAAKTSCLRGGQALAWLQPAALVAAAQTETSTQARGGCQHADAASQSQQHFQQPLWHPRRYQWGVT